MNPLTIFKLQMGATGAGLGQKFVVPKSDAINDKYRGGTNMIAYKEGFLGLIHRNYQIRNKKFYKHAFLWISGNFDGFKISREFFFNHRGVEFATSLMAKNDKIYIGYGIRDQSAWLDCYDAGIVDRFF
jgi:hypothetical protein